MFKKSLPVLASAILSVTFAAQAMAGSATDMAKAHIAAIGAGDLSAINSVYSDDSVFQWIGGPLDGVYRSKADIAKVWKKFTGAQGKLMVDVSDVQENGNPKGATVSANVKFSGKGKIPVRYVLTFRGGKLVNEVWQIDPKLKSTS